MLKPKVIHLLISVLIILGIFIPSSTVGAQSGPAEDHAGQPRDRVELTLRADGAPLPGGTAQLSLEVTPLINTPELKIQWVIPQGVELIGAEVESLSNVSANQAVHSERTLSFLNPGTYKIGVAVNLILAPDIMYGSSGVLFFIIDSTGSRVTDKDPDAHHRSDTGREQITVSDTPALIKPQAPDDDDPCFTIYAHFDRIERPLTNAGPGPDVRIPLAGIEVEFRESDFLFDDSYGYLATDANGNVAGSFCDDDGWFDDTLEIYLRVAAQRGDPAVYVEDSSWIDEEYEYDTGEAESSGGTINFSENLDYEWSGIFNIVDAAYLARQLWVDSGGEYDEETEIHWEDGYGDAKSYYDPYYNEITIADDPSDPDQWDESVIIHEWGHTADDYYSCDDSPGGDHAFLETLDSELAWGEGYPDYYQGAVRDTYGFPDSSRYLNSNGVGGLASNYNLESYDFLFSDYISTDIEGAIAAALWDLYDDVPDGQDGVSHGHALIQSVYISDEFNDVAYGFLDDTCEFDTYMRGWVDYGAPADAGTAGAIKQNTGYTLVPHNLVTQSASDARVTSDLSPADAYRWWKQLTYVADNSYSMTGAKFNAMQQLFAEAVNDLGDDPEGTEFTLDLFNNTSSTNDTAFAGQFFPDTLVDPINDLVPLPGPDTNCNVYALSALSQAIDDKEKSDVWLFTDGDTYQNPTVQNIRQQLNDQRLRASVALMGGCSALSEVDITKEPFSIEMLQSLTPEEQQSVMAERLLSGEARATLGPMAEEVPGGVVPYLLTAINSGGQFLYVGPDQLDDAFDILSAQITNSAGAGRWSDYVSDTATYRYDKLDWEYQWIDASSGTKWDDPVYNSKIDIPLPVGTYFQYYSGPYYNTVHVFEDGYLNFGLSSAYVSLNTHLPNPANPNNALYPFWDDLRAFCPPAIASPQACVGWIYTLQQGDWFVIEYYIYESFTPTSAFNTFEILLNLDTYEIRYQYQTVPNGAASATIGLENSNGSDGVEVSIDLIAGASNGMGYKFTPAPPQPTKTYTVTVDSSMDAIGFLLTGYSGTFEPLAISDPDGTLVLCSEAGALCLNQDLIQYVQVNTNGRIGDWHVVVDAGASGSGTFSFSSMATSPIAVEGSTNHTLATTAQQLSVQVTGAVDGCSLTGHFHLLNGSAFGSHFSLYDDGLHNDNHECDGLFGSDAFNPPHAGNAYLTLQGLHGGASFERVDTVPYNFQPIQLISLGDGANYGGPTPLQFRLTNFDSYNHCYWLSYAAPAGWWVKLPLTPVVCVNAGQAAILTYNAYLAAGETNTLPSGTTGVVTLSATEVFKGMISDSASARVTRYRPPYRIHIFNPTPYLPPNGETSTLEFTVVDEQNMRVADGTDMLLSVNDAMGIISPTAATTENGVFHATFTSGANLGTATITALVRDLKTVTASTDIVIANPEPDKITLETSATRLPANGAATANLVATVRDHWGNPMPGQNVNIGVEGDGQLGTIAGAELVSGVTDANGQFSAIFTSGTEVGVTGVRAELLYNQGSGLEAVLYDRKEIRLGMLIYLPITSR